MNKIFLIIIVFFILPLEVKTNDCCLLTIELEGIQIKMSKINNDEKKIMITLKSDRDVLIPDQNINSIFFEECSGYNDLGWYVEFYLGWNTEKINYDYKLKYRLLTAGEEIKSVIDVSKFNIIRRICINYSYVVDKEYIDKVLESKYHSVYYLYMRWGKICVDI